MCEKGFLPCRQHWNCLQEFHRIVKNVRREKLYEEVRSQCSYWKVICINASDCRLKNCTSGYQKLREVLQKRDHNVTTLFLPPLWSSDKRRYTRFKNVIFWYFIEDSDISQQNTRREVKAAKDFSCLISFFLSHIRLWKIFWRWFSEPTNSEYAGTKPFAIDECLLQKDVRFLISSFHFIQSRKNETISTLFRSFSVTINSSWLITVRDNYLLRKKGIR